MDSSEFADEVKYTAQRLFIELIREKCVSSNFIYLSNQDPHEIDTSQGN